MADNQTSTEETPDQSDLDYKEFERVQNLLGPVLTRAAQSYRNSVNGVWLGNGGAAVALLGFMASLSGLLRECDADEYLIEAFGRAIS